ncbi:hypothetical protein R1sor_006510 [Riccia sorocarpa]|uniref:Uncharacterized protein n=1 Tax=Riccia sorocarpa TaxID=122646 RepID=A0ABD3HQU4_9MARC
MILLSRGKGYASPLSKELVAWDDHNFSVECEADLKLFSNRDVIVNTDTISQLPKSAAPATHRGFVESSSNDIQGDIVDCRRVTRVLKLVTLALTEAKGYSVLSLVKWLSKDIQTQGPLIESRNILTKIPLREYADIKIASQQERKELDERAKAGEEVVKGGRGGKSLEAQEHLAEGRSKGGQTRADQLGTEGYQEMGSKGGQTRASQLGTEGYKEMGKKGGQDSGGEAAAKKGVEIDESKFTNPKE